MEVYILDSLLRRSQIIDEFESLIWTERMRAFGDFKLKVLATPENRTRLTVGSKLAMNLSYRVMILETVEDVTDSEGRASLSLTGRSLESILLDRIARTTLDDLTETPKWVITDTPANIARQIFHDICVLGLLDPGDVIPFVIEGSIFPADTIDEPADEITVEIDIANVYDVIRNLSESYGMGFRLVRNGDASQLYWDVYMGSDRSTQQSTLPAVIFSPDLDNLQNVRELTSTALYKNVAYVFSPVGVEVVYPLDVDPDVEGFERRVLSIKADDITDVDPGVASAKMIQRANEELSAHRNFRGFDGEIGQNSEYKYQTHYYLGDLTEIRNDIGTTSIMQVVEQIFSSDANGEKSYPTLAVNTFITPGVWIDWIYKRPWDDFDETEFWDTQP